MVHLWLKPQYVWNSKSPAHIALGLLLIVSYLPHSDAQCSGTNCTAGYYWDGSVCDACPVGHYCTGGGGKTPCPTKKYNPNTGRTTSASCLACPPGKLCAATGLSSPLPCTAGHRCVGNVDTADPCNPGYYAPSGSLSCTKCQAGYISESSAAANCTQCPANKVPNTGQTLCEDCRAGKSCTDPAQTPTDCKPGEYSLLGGGVCLSCPPGKKCPTTSAAVDCNPGFYSEGGQTACIQCPAGHFCNSTTRMSCLAGEFAAAGAPSCSPCPAGKMCPIGSASAVDCPSGYYQTSGGQASCIPCPAGSKCTSASSSPAQCVAGTYSRGSTTTCANCPAGAVCPTGTSEPIVCFPGFYVAANTDSNCTICPAGKACPSTTANPTTCATGTTSSAGQTSCTPCPAGYKCPSTSNPASNEPCANGTYSLSGQAVCTSCRAGFYCTDTTSNVEQRCTAGSYSAVGSSACTICPAGSMCPNVDGTSIATCLSGTYSESGSISCSKCPAGFACPYTDRRHLVACDAGTYSKSGEADCTACPAGKYCPDTLTDQVLVCADGFYSTGNQSACTRCPVGHECPSKESGTPTPCANGTYSLGGLVSCIVCPEGFHCPNTYSRPLSCPSGYYTLAKQTACTACEAGYMCPQTKGSYKVQCPPGQFSTNASTSCSTCQSGYVCPMGSTSATPPDGLCDQGYYCEDGKTASPCPAGTYNNRNGSNSLSDCLTCPAGYYCQGPGLVDYSLTPCPTGHYCLPGTAAATRYPCPAGTFNNVTYANSSSSCIPCLPGKYCLAGSSEASLVCPAGFYCLEGQFNGFQNACPLGTWSNQTGLTASGQCYNCPVGHFCPAGSQNSPTTAPTQCRAGTYNPLERGTSDLNCVPCDAGKACPTPGLSAPSHDCSSGYYCPNGTISSNQNPCIPGTFTNRTDLKSADECSPCPERFFCGWATSATNPPLPCTPGYYCPAQSPTGDKYPCPAGTYSDRADLAAASECTICPAGNYCIGGKTTTDGPCPRGYYCPNGTISAYTYGCPNGTYNDVEGIGAQAECKACTTGHYCSFADSAPNKCRAGTYMDEGYNSTTGSTVGTPAKRQDDCKQCTEGSYCLEAQVTPIPCGTAKYSKSGQIECVICQIGHYCDSETTGYTAMISSKKCPAGKFCAAGLVSHTSAPACSVGKYCVEACVEEALCPVGTMRTTTGAQSITDCDPCTAGSYCLEGSSTTSGQCDTGHYCPSPIPNPYASTPTNIGSYGSKQGKCPEGTYADTTGTTSEANCKQCTAGHFCKLATINPTQCPQGTFCEAGQTSPTPCPSGTYGSAPGLTNQTQCTACDPGKYCDAPGLTAPKGLCDPGYLCWSRATTKTPTDNVTGVLCPAGGYCVAGSYNATPCPLGTYSNTSGAVNTQDCRDCPQGYYCSEVAGGAPTGQCWGGYFCNGSAESPMQHIVSPGFYSFNGSTQALACPIGSYQDLEGQPRCKDCPPGYFCNQTTMTTIHLCEPGTYCPVNSTYERKCPPGTFSNRSALMDASNCTDCPPGYYCSNRGITEPSGKCRAGHVCYGSALYDNPFYNNDTSKNQTLVLWGDVCQPGYYCPAGSYEMYPCPRGTYNSNPAMSNETTDCLACTPGKYCDAIGLAAPTGDCSAGYYCTSRATNSTPAKGVTGGPCPTNYFCPQGISDPRSCETGKMANRTGMSECELCPNGFLCETAVAPVECPTGKYCPASGLGNLLLIPKNCPEGTFNPLTGIYQESQCMPCTAGSYCETIGLSAPTGPMNAGSWSLKNAKQKAYTDINGLADSYGICPRGFYCPSNTSSPIQCPRGRYGTTSGTTNLAGCVECPLSYYCPDLNSTQCDTFTKTGCGVCTDGYYCLRGSPTPTPINATYGDVCPKGHRCTQGSKTACVEGKYQNLTQQTTCLTCPAGFYCGSATEEPVTCPSGSYCLEGTTPSTIKVCLAGTFNNVTGAPSIDYCLQCPPGMYCQNTGLTNPMGPCQAGFYCIRGSANATFSAADATGGPCTRGHYCPEGSTEQVKCPAGHYCPDNMQTNYSLKCSPGFYCTLGAYMSNPTDGTTGNQCNMGYYCTEGSSFGQACPPGTYRNVTGGATESDCFICPAGYYCAGQANVNPTNSCMAGFYCTAGSGQPNPSNQTCPQGHYCPTQSIAPIRCPSGTYQDKVTQGDCITCPAGYYCDNTKEPVVLFNSSICPEGYYCPDGTKHASEFPCPVGTFNNITGMRNVTDCQGCVGSYYCDELALKVPTKLCTQGFFCRRHAASATPNQGEDAGICPAGFYCPPGTSEPNPCPLGTYSNRQGLNQTSECLVCTSGSFCGGLNSTAPTAQCQEGYYCPNGSERATQSVCPTGHYCPMGSGNPTPCPIPMWSNRTHLKADSECTACPAGSYCDVEGLTSPAGDCKEGYYCPVNTSQQMPNATYCPSGHYCPTGSAAPLPCRNGTYMNHTHAPACYACPAGYYCAGSGSILPCTRGYYCPEGTGLDLQACPEGTYGSRTHLSAVGECTACDGGKYCNGSALTAPFGDCNEGYWCASGVDIGTPGNSNTTDTNVTAHSLCRVGWGGRCPKGHYCPTGVVFPLACPNGTYADVEGLALCIPCMEGYYCLSGSEGYLDKPCPSGYYCPNGTIRDQQYPCPAGTFNNQTKRTSLSDCVNCPGGKYCNAPGLSSPTGDCLGGYFCNSSSTTATPFGAGGDKCLAGYFCPTGSSAMQPCTGGQYCVSDYLNSTSGNCTAGFYCTSRASSSTPTDGTTGNECPQGAFCPEGSASYSPCPAGTYLNRTRATQASDCINCPAGQFCSGSGNANPRGPCQAGYYCPEGQSSDTPANYTCTAGHYCPVGSTTPIVCPNGTYQNEVGQSDCKGCPAGYFCDNSVTPTVHFNSSGCPSGYYCPVNTTRSNEFACPTGTFNNITHRTQLSECQPCSPGKYCSVIGLSSPDGTCSAGFYCRSGAASATPVQDANANECPIGFYCPLGSTNPLSCSPGTYSNTTRLTDASECLNCTATRYCPEPNMTAPGPQCQPGYYCPLRADRATFLECPAGSYCPLGSAAPTPCPQGTYSNTSILTAEAECTNCTAGFYCQQTGLTYPEGKCQQGYYCVKKSGTPNPQICPIGMHCPEGSATPSSCVAGQYTNATGRWTCETCPDGYYCLPVNFTNAGTAGVFDCPMGYYCANGTGLDHKPCPAGTYSQDIRLSVITQCRDCDGGRYCAGNGNTNTTGPCAAGYYCKSGLDRPNPDSNSTNSSLSHICPIIGGHTGFGDVCPLGHYCPEGSTLPQGCEAGKYQDQIGQATCKTCPAGYFCIVNSTEYASQPCPVGHYCPSGTPVSTQNPCPAGSFQPHLSQINDSSCLSCTAGKYCLGSGLSAPTNSCDPGWYCSGGAKNATPLAVSEGGQCQPGTFCPLGSSGPTQCTPGYYCGTAGLENVTAPCDPGWYCILSANTARPTDGTTGNVCPMGNYCPQGSSSPTKCPQGFYLNSTGNSAQSSCISCDPGKFCDSEGLPVASGDCSPGFFCPVEQVTATPSNHSCPQGHLCIGGLGAAQPCPSGTYQDQTAQSSCKTCPERFYCNASSGPVIYYASYNCPNGHYCPNGTASATQYPCPIGTYNNGTGLARSDECTACAGGMACDRTGLTVPERDCAAGFFCKRSAQSTSPRQGADADICPVGHYCPQQTTNPIPCEAGTFSNSTGLQQASDCLNCTSGFFCNSTGLTDVAGECIAGYYCPPRSISPSRIICPIGHYCLKNSGDPTKCPNGTFNNRTGVESSAGCNQCTPGWYCPTTGMTAPQAQCDAGYYCPLGSDKSQQVVCPIGAFCPTGSPNYQLCPDAQLTETTAQSSCSICPENYYCASNLISVGDVSSVKHACPQGFFCPNGTGYDWRSCPVGTFSNTTGLSKETECIPCTGGNYCQGANLTSPTAPCDAGFYCTSGVKTATPSGSETCVAGHNVVGNVCPKGHYCPTGTDYPIGCPAGSYQDLLNEAFCKGCPAGYYCLANTTEITSSILCPVGHYCPLNTTQANANPCPPGTFNNATGGESSIKCLSCTPGSYCAGYANENPDNLCQEGYYCPGGASNATDRECQAGTFCPTGSFQPSNCTAGQYCSRSALRAPEGPCDAGWYCPMGSSSRQQIRCPIGHHCVAGSALPMPCDNGTFGPTEGLRNQSECSPCTQGYYCNSTGLSAVIGACSPGYYCPPGQTTPTPFDYMCPVGHYCAGGKGAPEICPMGQFQNLKGQASCKFCHAGFYCDNSGGAIGNLTGRECITGHYCLNGTGPATQHPCPRGTYLNTTGADSESQCNSCKPQYACTTTGLTNPDTLCMAGYFCTGGNNVSNPSEGYCTIGSYCPEGVAAPIPCPAGSIAPGRGNTNLTDCKPCPPGNYCTPASSAIGISLQCQGGFICVSASDIPNPTDGTKGYICPTGHYCPAGAVAPIVCPVGTYGPRTGLSECLSCPAGTTCPGLATNVTTPCPAGYYCANGTSDNGTACPLGTYNPYPSRSTLSECISCDPGKYCGTTALTAPTGNCTAGYLCVGGAQIGSPNDGTNAPCPVGRYCISGTVNATKCPLGTYRQTTGAAAEADCDPCQASYYCGTTGLSSPTGQCAERYYCPATSKISSNMPTDHQCPTGHYCPTGTGDPIPCSPGKYQPNIGSTTCIDCPAGYYCLANTSIPLPCPAYHYCPGATIDPIHCPNGTRTNDTTTGLSLVEQCSHCPPGQYCVGGRIAGDCAPGYWCKQAAKVPNPEGNATVGELCPEGYYCPAGTPMPRSCPLGKVINIRGAYNASQCDICSPGYVCPPDAKFAKPCPPGYYCQYGTNQTACPKYTFNSQDMATNVTWCLPCTAGYFCDMEGMANVSTSPCPAGSYCPEACRSPIACPAGTYRDSPAAASAADCHPCPAGFYCPHANVSQTASIAGVQCDEGYFCPLGSQNQTKCQAGYYCNMSKTQDPCPPGYYCPAMSASPIRCPQGHYCGGIQCPNDTDTPGAIEPIKCPEGYYEPTGSLRSTFADTCFPCAPGTYGNDTNRASCKTCKAGVVCLQAATTDIPSSNSSYYFGVNSTRSYPCPTGYYCPAGTGNPIPCPTGRFLNLESGTSLDSCILCPVDTFQYLEGQDACLSCGSEAVQPTTGSATCQCSGEGRDFQISDRRCPCRATFVESSRNKADCEKTIYPRCTDTQTRDQYGQCYDEAGWATKCKSECGADAYIGYDLNVPMCLCQVDDLDAVCDSVCRETNKEMLTLHCPALPTLPFVRISNSDKHMIAEIPLENLQGLINAANAISSKYCTDPSQNSSVTISITETSGAGFLGVYLPNATQLANSFESNAKGTYSTNLTGSSSGGLNTRRLLATSTVAGSSYSGILNPVTCLEYGQVMTFTVSPTSYPVYDRTNLMNTNDKFDYGGFRTLVEKMTLMSSTTTLFAFRFTDPGNYVFKLNNDDNKRMYIRVMAQGTTCPSTGPFLPATPNNFVQSGMKLQSDIIKEPNWVLIGIFIGCLVIAVILFFLIIYIFRKYGWNKISWITPFYRYITQRYNFDEYSSRGTVVNPYIKHHPNGDSEVEVVAETARTGPFAAAELGVALPNSEFWDYERQLDLEAFSSKTVYDTLERQSVAITRQIGKQKDRMKDLYQKLNTQADSLKSLWLAKLQRGVTATQEQQDRYQKRLEELEAELKRRREMGELFAQSLRRQGELVETEETARRKHYVEFEATSREIQRLLHNQANLSEKQVAQKCRHLLEEAHRSVDAESSRLGHSLVIGGQLLVPGSNEIVLGDEEVTGNNLSDRAKEILSLHKVLGVNLPRSSAQVLTHEGECIPAPPDSFIHPFTGRLLPLAAHIVYDSPSARFMLASNAVSPALPSSASPLPFVPHPRRAPVKLRNSLNKETIAWKAPMACAKTGLTVPTLAVTLDPETQTVLPVGGTHIDPVTGLPVAIEIGGLMLDPLTKLPVPIIGTCIDPDTGDVLPVGAKHLLLFDLFTEPLSGRAAKVHCAGADSEEALRPGNGGRYGYMTARTLVWEMKTLDVLEELIKQVGDGKSPGAALRTAKLEGSLKELKEARTAMKCDMLQLIIDTERRRLMANELGSTGGSPGWYEYAGTGKLLPVLVGTLMEDPGGSEFDVPILGCRKSEVGVRPLGGTMEDPNGAGLVPITIGRQAVDPTTGELGAVVGVSVDAETSQVIPATVRSTPWRRRQPDPISAALVEQEMMARRSYWRRVKNLEEEVTMAQFQLSNRLVHSRDDISRRELTSGLEKVSGLLADLDYLKQHEVQRRIQFKEAFSDAQIAECVPLKELLDNDDLEKDSGDTLTTVHKKYISSVERLFGRMREEERNFKESVSYSEEVGDENVDNLQFRHERRRAQLRTELIQAVLTLTETLDRQHMDHCYFQRRSELLLEHAYDFYSGTLIVAGDYYASFTTTEVSEGNDELLALLRHLIALLEGGGPFYLSTEILNLLQGGSGGLTVVQGDHTATTGVMTMHQTRTNIVVDTENIQQRGANTGLDLTIIATGSGVGPDGSPLPQTQPEDREAMFKDIYAKQALEVARGEANLRRSEIREINVLLEDTEQKKKASNKAIADQLAESLKKAKTSEEAAAIMAASAKQMEKHNDALEAQKQDQLQKLREKLLKHRSKDKKNMKRQHMEEMEKYGFKAEDSPEIRLQTKDEMNNDLIRLQGAQEEVLSDIKRAQEGEDAFDPGKMDRINSMRSGGILPDSPDGSSFQKSIDEAEAMKKRVSEMMKERKGQRGNPKKDAEKMLKDANLSDEEKAELQQQNNRIAENEREIEHAALLGALHKNLLDGLDLKGRQLLETQKYPGGSKERDKILHQYDVDVARLRDQLGDNQTSQKDAVLAKLAARKRMREAESREAAVDEELHHMGRAEAEKQGIESTGAFDSLQEKLGSEVEGKLENLRAQQAAQLEAKEIEHLAMMRSAVTEVNKEEDTAINEMDKQIEEQKRLSLEAHQSKLERELNAQPLAQADYDKLLEKYARQGELLASSFEQERDKQRAALRAKMAKRRQKRADELQEVHNEEMAAVMTEQQKARAAFIHENCKDVEGDILSSHTAGLGRNEAENMIYHTLLQRHLKEMVDLEGELDDTRAAKVSREVNEVKRDRAQEREKLLEAYEEQTRELMKNIDGLSPDNLEKRKKEMKERQDQQLKQFDEMTDFLLNKVKKDTEADCDLKGTHKRLDLKERQLRELADAMRLYSPEDKLKEKYARMMQKYKDDADAYRKDKLKQLEDELQKAKDVYNRIEKEKQEALKRKLAAVEADVAAEMKREEESMKRLEDARLAATKEKLEEKGRREKARIEGDPSLSADEKARLLKEFRDNEARLKSSLDNERNEARRKMEERLKIKRQRKKVLIAASAIEEEQATTEKRLMEELMNKYVIDGSRAAQNAPEPFDSDHWIMRLLANSPLFSAIVDIDDLLEKTKSLKDTTGLELSDDEKRGVFVDERDSQFKLEGKLSAVDLSALSPAQVAIYQFGVMLINLLHRQLETPNVKLLLAETLPVNNYKRNAFKNSVFYEHASDTLFIRKERAENVGDLMVTIIHSVAHIHTGDMTDDNDPIHLKYFYKALRVVSRHVLFYRDLSSLIDDPQLKKELKPDLIAKLMNERVDQTTQLSDDKSFGTRSADYERQRTRQAVHSYLTYNEKPSYQNVQDRLQQLMKKRPAGKDAGSSGKADRALSGVENATKNIDKLYEELSNLGQSLTDHLRRELSLMEDLKMAGDDKTKDKIRNEVNDLILKKQEVIAQQKRVDAEITTQEKQLRAGASST